jgi:hypothetical protein
MVAIRLLRQFVIPVDYSGMICQPAEAKQADGGVSTALCLCFFFFERMARKDGGQVFTGEIREVDVLMQTMARRKWRGQSKLGPGPRERALDKIRLYCAASAGPCVFLQLLPH